MSATSKKKGQFLSLRDKRPCDKSFPVYANAMLVLTCFSVRAFSSDIHLLQKARQRQKTHHHLQALKRSYNAIYQVHTFVWGS